MKEAIQGCHDAGVRVFMITGDAMDTARGIAADIGLSTNETDRIIAQSFVDMSPGARLEWLKDRQGDVVFSRALPEV